jgi:hypothetical protein
LKLNKQLSLVIECDGGDTPIYVHAEPIPRDVFDRFALTFAQTFEAIYMNGASLAGARIAKTFFVNAVVSRINDADNSEAERKRALARDSLEAELFAPMRQFANVLSSKNGHWEHWQLDDAVHAGILDETDKSEVENILTFFTVLYHIHLKSERERELRLLLKVWNARIEYLRFTEFLNSLPTSTPGGNTGEKAKASSIPV